MPLRVIRSTFRKSEVFIVGWRSQEVAAKMRTRFRNPVSATAYQSDGINAASRSHGSSRRKSVDGQIPQGLPDHFFNKEGEVDLRQVTGAEAWKYFAAQGIKLPVFPRSDGK